MKTDIALSLYLALTKLVVLYQVQPFRPRLRCGGGVVDATVLNCTVPAGRTRCRPTGGGTGLASDASGPCSGR